MGWDEALGRFGDEPVLRRGVKMSYGMDDAVFRSGPPPVSYFLKPGVFLALVWLGVCAAVIVPATAETHYNSLRAPAILGAAILGLIFGAAGAATAYLPRPKLLMTYDPASVSVLCPKGTHLRWIKLDKSSAILFRRMNEKVICSEIRMALAGHAGAIVLSRGLSSAADEALTAELEEWSGKSIEWMPEDPEPEVLPESAEWRRLLKAARGNALARCRTRVERDGDALIVRGFTTTLGTVLGHLLLLGIVAAVLFFLCFCITIAESKEESKVAVSIILACTGLGMWFALWRMSPMIARATKASIARFDPTSSMLEIRAPALKRETIPLPLNDISARIITGAYGPEPFRRTEGRATVLLDLRDSSSPLPLLELENGHALTFAIAHINTALGGRVTDERTDV